MWGDFTQSVLACVLVFIAVCSEAVAGPLPPTVRAALSANGRVLCYVEMKQHSDNGGVSYKIDSVTYHVLTFTEAAGPNSYIGTLVPATGGHFWTDFAEDWSITLSGTGALRWPIVSDDGATLALASYDSPIQSSPLLQVYHHKPGSPPSLVGSYMLADLWSAEEIKSIEHPVFGGLEMWYRSGNFTFVPGELIYTNPWHDATHINVETGKLTHAASTAPHPR